MLREVFLEEIPKTANGDELDSWKGYIEDFYGNSMMPSEVADAIDEQMDYLESIGKLD